MSSRTCTRRPAPSVGGEILAFPSIRHHGLVERLVAVFSKAQFGRRFIELDREYTRIAAERRAIGLSDHAVRRDLLRLQLEVGRRLAAAAARDVAL